MGVHSAKHLGIVFARASRVPYALPRVQAVCAMVSLSLDTVHAGC